MTTNPPPLTAYVVAQCLFPAALIPDSTEYYDWWLEVSQRKIEAYAAQQNAELVEENERLNEMASNRAQAIELYSNDVATCANRCKELQAKNERLKQQLADAIDNINRLIWNCENPTLEGSTAAMENAIKIAKSSLPQPPKEAT